MKCALCESELSDSEHVHNQFDCGVLCDSCANDFDNLTEEEVEKKVDDLNEIKSGGN